MDSSKQDTLPTNTTMARLSGLPSEHHHEGPGDAPRRKRGRPSTKNQRASQEPSASTGKRTASPSAELSQTKRAKHTPVIDEDDEDQIAQEIQQSFSRSQRGDTIHVETQASSSTTRRPNRRHSEPPVAAQDDDQDDERNNLFPSSTQPQPGLTPHLNRIGAARRDLLTTRRARMSMPAQLHIERIDEETDGTQFQYAPLTAVLDSRTRRRLRRSHLSQEVNAFEDHQKKDKKMLLELRKQLRAQDEKIRDLEYSLEARRLGEIDITDDHAEKLELELEQAREEIDKLRASSLYNGSDRDMSVDNVADMSEDEDEEMLLVHPEELHLERDISYTHVPEGKYAARVQELSSQMTFESLTRLSQLTHDTLLEEDEDIVPDKIQDQAVERYERELQHYIRILADAQGALRVLALELQNLHFIDPGHSSNDIVVELRHGFDTLRAEVDKFFPDTTTDLTNQQLLRKIPELFSGLFFELREKLTVISTSQKTEILLRRQYEGVLDLLGESEERIQELEKNSYHLDKVNEEKQRTILDLEEQVTTLTELADGQELKLKKNDAQINGLKGDIEDKETTLNRLREALETYRKDLDNVTKTATEFEKDHYETIERMEAEHAEQMQDLSNELVAEQEARDAAEGDAQQKGEIIDDLEERIERMESEVTAITETLTELRGRLADQITLQETTERQRDEQAEIAHEYGNTIEDLNQAIVDLKDQLVEARDNLEAERRQREHTENALDETNEKLEEANQQLHNAGLQANELRSKLFQLQQDKELAIAELQEEAQEREDDLNGQLDAESSRRETAEKTVAKLNKDIEQIQAELATAQVDYANMSEAREELEQDRERQSAALNQQLADLKAKYTALETSSKSTITSLQANITDLNNQVQRQQSEIKRLTEEIAAQTARYEEDTTQLKDEIEVLKGDLADERGENDRNRKEITSLSERVENEANELLNMMSAHGTEVDALKTVIATHESTIKHLQATAEQRSAEHEELVTERMNEIEELRLESSARMETITMLEASVESLKAKFAAQEQDTRETIDALNLAHRRLVEENEKLTAAHKKRFADTLKAVQDMKVERVEVKSQSVKFDRVQSGKVVKTTDKMKVGKKGAKKKVSTRSWRDSGYGMDEVEDGPSKIDGEDGDDFLAV